MSIDASDLKQLGNTSVKIPAIGLGTWGIGGTFSPDYSRDDYWIKLIRDAINVGVRMIDTAEMYGAGHAEELVGESIKGFDREELFIITKVLPNNLSYDRVISAAKKSLARLKTKYIDLYLIHWYVHGMPLRDVMRALEKLVNDGLVRFIGISNFSVREMEEARSYLSYTDIVANQVKYSIADRGIERDILPYAQREKITIIAYTPLEHGRLARNKILAEIGKKYNKTAAQVALNWLISKPRVVTIPKAGSIEHVKENLGAMGWRLSRDDIEYLDREFH